MAKDAIFKMFYLYFSYFNAALAIESGLSEGANNLGLGAFLIAVNLVVLSLVFGLAANRHWLKEKERKARLQRQAMNIKDHRNVDQHKIESIFDTVRSTVPPSNALVFYYSNISNAKAAIKTGLPCHEEYGSGVVFSLHLFHLLDDHDKAAFPSQEVVLACEVPQALLNPLDDSSTSSSLRIVPSAALRAVRDIRDPVARNNNEVFFPPGHIMRAYQLTDELSTDDEEKNKKRNQVIDVLYKPTIKEVPVTTPTTCQEYVDAMNAIRDTCKLNSWVPLYHYTMEKLGPVIGETGFRMSTKVLTFKLTPQPI